MVINHTPNKMSELELHAMYQISDDRFSIVTDINEICVQFIFIYKNIVSNREYGSHYSMHEWKYVCSLRPL